MSNVRSEEMPQTPRATHIAITLSVALAVVGVAMASIFHDSPKLQSLEIALGLKPATNQLTTSVDSLLTAASLAGNTGADKIIYSFIASHSPNQIAATANVLFAKSDTALAGPLAMQIAETAASRYDDNRLYLMVANQYITGKAVAKNLVKAKAILEMTALESEILTDFYLGRIWIDDANPSRDIDKAAFHYKNAADKGYAPARAALEKIK